MANQFSLLRQRRFAPFFGAQFMGAFNDNLFKTALVTVVTLDTLRWTTLDAGLLNNLIAGLFAGEINPEAIEQMPDLYLRVVIGTVVAGIVLIAFVRPIRKLMGGVR